MSATTLVPARDTRTGAPTPGGRANSSSERMSRWAVGSAEHRALVRQLVEGPDVPAQVQLHVPSGWRPGLVPSLFARVPERWREALMAFAFAMFALVVGPLGMVAVVTGHGSSVMLFLGVIVPALFVPVPARLPFAVARARRAVAASIS